MMKKSIKLKTAILIWVLVFALSIGTTFAIITWSSGNTILAGSTMCFDIGYIQGQDIDFGTTNSSGVVENGMTASLTFDESNSASTSVSFQRKPSCELYGIGTITANISVTPSNVSLSTGALKYKIINENTSVEVASGSITKTGESIIYDDFIINENVTYKIYFWLDANYIDNTYLEATFSGTIGSSAISTTEYGEIDEEYISNIGPGTLYYQLASNAVMDNVASTYVTSSTGIDFEDISSDTNGKGIYIRSGTEEAAYPIYYYRGAVENNNLIFADFCWKIVRTTETGGTKLIYNGTPTDGTCDNTGEATQIGTSAFNVNSNSPAYVGYMYGTPYEITTINYWYSYTDTFYFGNDVTYSNGTYTLTDTISGIISEMYNTEDEFSNYHYTCLSTGKTCTSVYYIYINGGQGLEYITLTEGKKVEDALSEMLDYNTNSSAIKGNKDTEGTLDYWYYNNIEQNGYDSYIEDTVWCYDRSINDIAGWNPNGGSIDVTRGSLDFGEFNSYNVPQLSCTRNIDKFTVNELNGNGDLDYPIGLLSYGETQLAGALSYGIWWKKYNDSDPNINNYLNNGSYYYWIGSPGSFLDSSETGANVGMVMVGITFALNVDLDNAGIRPSVSLKAGTVISEGTGTVDNPYVVG